MKKAFTLIELLVVVLIIGILAAIALPQYQLSVLKARYATWKNIVENIVQAQEIYYMTNGTYAASFDELGIDRPISPWGQCSLHISGKMARCYNDVLAYRHSYKYSDYPNRRECVATVPSNDKNAADNLVQSKVCVQETQEKNVGFAAVGTAFERRYTYK